MTVETSIPGMDLLGYLPSSEWLTKTAEAKKHEYQLALPFPHISFDNFLPEAVAEAVLAAFPGPEDIEWIQFKNAREVKLAKNQEKDIPPVIRNLLYALNGRTFLRFLEVLTGIEPLIPDPELIGGGMHQIVRGGKLGVHVDFNKHPSTKLDRRLNLLIYLNKDWQDEYGGHFQLWDTEGKECRKKILPIFNRCALFSTSEVSYHGHPEPLECPPGWSRKSLALYYYSNGRPENEKAHKHSTIFLDTPSEKAAQRTLGTLARRALKEITPPILTRLFGSKE